jgi:hypothetical protein
MSTHSLPSSCREVGLVAYLIFVAALSIAYAPASSAQDVDSPKLTYFAGPGTTLSHGTAQAATQFGASFDGAPPNSWFGLLFEVGYVAPWSNFKAGSAFLSANYMAAWSLDKKQRWLPFATVGYSRLFGTGNAANFGGGLDYRYKNNDAIRFELRDYATFTGPRQHDVALRFGFVFYVPD